MIAILGLLLAVVSAKLRIMTPYELQQQFISQNNSIPYSVANFGHIPWGRKLIGTVVLADPIEACDPLKSLHASTDKPFVLLKRGGGCTFVTKVRNVQQLGASLAIIIDNQLELTQNLIMKDDGFGYTISIPSIFIGEKEGEMIEKFIRDEQTRAIKPELKDYHHSVMLSMHFDVQKREYVSVFFALTFQNRESFKLVREFAPFYEQMKDEKNAQFDVFYDQYVCPSCYDQQFTQAQSDCLGGGRYCQYDPDGESTATGRQIMEEQLRQLCIFQVDRDNWWNYVPRFDKNCVSVQAYEFCSREVMKHYDINQEKVDKCIQSSFNTSSGGNRLTQQNYILDKQQEFKYPIIHYSIRTSSGLKFYPGAVINNQSYLGAIDARDIFGEICNSWTQTNPECSKYFDEEYIKSSGSGSSNIGTIIAVVVLVLVVFFLFMVFIYRRMVRKEMSREMSSQVNQMVSQYISFYEAKEKKGGN